MSESISQIWSSAPEQYQVIQGTNAKPPRPFFTVLGKSEEALHKWLKNAFEYCREFYKPYHRSIQQNISIYQGLSYRTGITRSEYEEKTFKEDIEISFDYPADGNNFTNYAQELTEELINSITGAPPSIAAYPANSDEPQDILNAVTVKLLLDTIQYDTRWTVSVPQFVRNTKIGGECWQFITWDEDKGDVFPAAKDAEKQFGGEIPLTDEYGNPRKEDGEPLMLSRPPRMGDVVIDYSMAEHVFPQPLPFGEDPEWVMRLRFKHIDFLKTKFPNYSKNISPDKGNQWDYSMNKMCDYGEIATVIEFYHKDTIYVPGGYQCQFTTETLLETSKLKYRHGELPCEKLTDMDVPGVTRGVSYLRNTKNLQRMINHMHALVHRNFDLFSHPKWLVEIGSINKKHLRRMPGIIPIVPGTTPPQLLNFQATSPEVYNYIEKCKEEIRLLSGIHPVSQGEIPAGMESGIALSLLREEENKRHSTFITKYNDWIVRVWRKVLSVASEKYSIFDKRMIRVVGKNNEYIYKVFNAAILEKPYDVRLQNQSALGDTKAAKVSGLMELFGRGVLSKDELRENLELGNLSKIYRDSMEPQQTALWENEQMMNGQEMEVETTDDHEKHYRIHYPILQQHHVRSMPDQIKGSLSQDSPFFGKGISGHLLNHVKYMVDEVKVEMAVAGQSPKMMQYSQLSGFLLMARFFLSPEEQTPGSPAGGPPQSSGAPASNNSESMLAPTASPTAIPQEGMARMLEPMAPQSP